MAAIENFRNALKECHIDESLIAQIMQGYENMTDKVTKEKRATFFAQAMTRMDGLLEPETCRAIRDACACSKGGWRLNAVQELAKEYEGKPLAEKVQALRRITHMGNPTLNDDGTLTAGIGGDEGCPCACPVFSGPALSEPVSVTYCYCCAGHFRHHYQIALGKKLTTKRVVSSALESLGRKPCRFVFEIEA
jgi:hypothetical protein